MKEIFENYVTSESSIYTLTITTCTKKAITTYIPINMLFTHDSTTSNLSLIITCLIVGLIDHWTNSNTSFLCCYSRVAENCCLTGENMYRLSFPLSYLLKRIICWWHSSPGHLQKWSRKWVEHPMIRYKTGMFQRDLNLKRYFYSGKRMMWENFVKHIRRI